MPNDDILSGVDKDLSLNEVFNLDTKSQSKEQRAQIIAALREARSKYFQEQAQAQREGKRVKKKSQVSPEVVKDLLASLNTNDLEI